MTVKCGINLLYFFLDLVDCGIFTSLIMSIGCSWFVQWVAKIRCGYRCFGYKFCWCKNSCCGESWLSGTNLMWLLLYCELCIVYWSCLLCIVYWSCVICTRAGCCVLCIGVVNSVLELYILYWNWLLYTVYWSGCCCYN